MVLFATLHGEILKKLVGKQASIDKIINANFVFMVAVVLMLVVVIFYGQDNSLSPLFYRILAASGIIDATLTLVSVIMRKLFLQKHPSTVDPVFNLTATGSGTAQAAPKRHMNIFVTVLIVFVGLQFLGSLVIFGISAILTGSGN